MLASYLKQAKAPAIIWPKTLAVAFSADYNAAREYCQSPNALSRLDELIKRVAGPDWSIRIESSSREPSQPAQGRPEERVGNYRTQRAEAIKHPLVQAVMEKFDATMVEVEDNFGTPIENGRPQQTDGTESGTEG